MRRVRLVAIFGALASVAVGVSAFRARTAPPAARHEVIAVYLGTVGTDARPNAFDLVRDMQALVKAQAMRSGREFVSRGVSLEGSVEEGLRHLAMFTHFDEVSVGGNWTNSSVVRYLGSDIDSTRAHRIPQVILYERDVTTPDSRHLQISPEREIGRFVGLVEIGEWVTRGAPLPR